MLYVGITSVWVLKQRWRGPSVIKRTPVNTNLDEDNMAGLFALIADLTVN